MDNNNNMMEINTEESQKKKERQEKIDGVKKKFTGFLDKLKEDREDRQRAKEEEKRVKEQEKQELAAFAPKPAPPKPAPAQQSSGGFSGKTITNQTISGNSNPKAKPQLSPQEQRRRKQKRKRIIRNIMTIPEIIFIVLLALFLKNKYIDYSKDVHQVLNYSAGDYMYAIHRDNQTVLVVKNHRKECATAPCELEKVSEYEVKFGKNQMTAIRVFMDLKFKFKNGTKDVTISDIKTELGKKCLYGMIHNNDYFLGFKSYSKYTLVDFEQMGTYTKKGYKYTSASGKYTLDISMGEKNSGGYALVVNSVFKQGDDLYIYVQEQLPEDTTTTSVITHPMITIDLQEAPKNIFVYDIESGEQYPSLDGPTVPNAEPAVVQNRKLINGIVGDLAGILQKENEKANR